MGAGWGRKGWWAVADLVILIYALVPVLWIVSLSFKPLNSINDGRFVPAEFTWSNYQQIFQLDSFVSALRNSIGIALIATALSVVIGTLAAYAIARLSFPGKKLLVSAALLISMFPQISSSRQGEDDVAQEIEPNE